MGVVSIAFRLGTHNGVKLMKPKRPKQDPPIVPIIQPEKPRWRIGRHNLVRMLRAAGSLRRIR